MTEVKILIEGWTNAESLQNLEEENDACTTSLIRDEGIVAIVDPGIMDSKQTLIDSLKAEGLEIKDITHIFLTHSHIDHYRNVGMFDEQVPVLEYWGIWTGNKVKDWTQQFSKNIKIIKTPGHSYDGLTFLVDTKQGKVAVVGDVFWKEGQPADDPYAINMDQLIETRLKVIEISDFIIPGHGNIYKVKKD